MPWWQPVNLDAQAFAGSKIHKVGGWLGVCDHTVVYICPCWQSQLTCKTHLHKTVKWCWCCWTAMVAMVFIGMGSTRQSNLQPWSRWLGTQAWEHMQKWSFFILGPVVGSLAFKKIPNESFGQQESRVSTFVLILCWKQIISFDQSDFYLLKAIFSQHTFQET